MKNAKTGLDEKTNLYISRYYAKKAALSYQVIAKVEGGYKIMEPYEYYIWRKLKMF